jgi:dTMP kinase
MGRWPTGGFALSTAGAPGGGAHDESRRRPLARAASSRASRTLNGHAKSLLERPHPHRGRLIAVEGIDGSGKSTQLQLVARWLSALGHRVQFTEWNSSQLVRRALRRGKKKDVLTPTTFSLLHAVDFADRLTYQIMPPLRAGMIVLCDRYAYTAFARDVARGVHPEWVRAVYSFAPRPDLTLYFRVPIEVSLRRLLTGRTKLKYHEAGMDLGLASNAVDSFRLFQSRVLDGYDALTREFGLSVIDATGDVAEQQQVVRGLVERALEGYEGLRLHGGSNGRAVS